MFVDILKDTEFNTINVVLYETFVLIKLLKEKGTTIVTEMEGTFISN